MRRLPKLTNNSDATRNDIKSAIKTSLILSIVVTLFLIGWCIWGIVDVIQEYHEAIEQAQTEMANTAIRDIVLLNVIILILVGIIVALVFVANKKLKKLPPFND